MSSAPPARRRPLRAIAIGLVVLVVIVAAAAAGLALSFDPNALKPRIAAAVERATGRTFAINGPITLLPSLVPGIALRDVAFANMPGGSPRPMVSVERVEARINPLSLLSGRIEVVSITLSRPDLLLEIDAAGRANWRFTPEVAPATGPAEVRERPRFAVAVDRVGVSGGKISWHDARSSTRFGIDVAHLDAAEPSPEASLSGEGAFAVAGHPFTATFTTGSLARLEDRAASDPWQVSLALETQDGRATLGGGIAKPLQAAGYAFDVAADLKNLGALEPILGRKLPPLHDVAARAHVSDASGRLALTDINLHAGPSDLGAVLPDLTLADLTATAPAFQAPFKTAARASYRGTPFDLAANVTLQTSPRISLHDLSLTATPIQASGNVDISATDHPAISGSLNARHVDADALAALARPPARPAPAAPQAAPPPPQAGPQAAPGAPAATALLSDEPLPLDGLRHADADLTLAIGELQVRHAMLHDVSGHVVLHDGRLAVDPLQGQIPGGRLDGALSVDATAAAPAVSVRARAPSIALATLTAALGVPGDVTGNADLDLDLKGAGASPHALLASADGYAGLAMVDGALENRALVALVGGVLRGAKLPDTLGGSDTTQLRCLALRLNVAHGVGDVGALVLDTSRVLLQGGGTINLADEALALRLRPMLRTGGSGIVVPVRVGGTLRDPKIAVDENGALAAGISALSAERGGDPCPAALNLARGGQPGPAAPPASGAEAHTAKPPNAAKLLRSLLR